MGTTDTEGGSFVISLDFELMWGVRDHATRESYGGNVLGGREAIPAMLDLFQRRGIRATWATVGALLCESKDELLARAKQAEASHIADLEDVGSDERRDPYHFGASLARLIASCEGQEIGTHTYSHRCALEQDETVETFAADVAAALAQLEEWKIRCRSIVFPRNQYGPAHLEACHALGLSHFRGNERAWFYAPAPGCEQTKARRLCRLADSYINISGPNVARPERGDEPLANVASSRFLRPFDRRLSSLDGFRLRRIETAMQAAAETGGTFHLWWHPENFGRNLAENMAILTKILDGFEKLRSKYGMRSRAMHEVAGPAPALSTARAPSPATALAS
jgi:peptidoglycan/xylan/chitin deacetylase (PgdA/CDA1 family)